MARSLTVEELEKMGFSPEEAEAIVQKQNQPKPKRVYWQFRATEEEAMNIASAHPDFEFEKRYQPKD